MSFAHLSLKNRVHLVLAAVLALVVAIGSVLVIQRVRQAVREETRSALQVIEEMSEALTRQPPLPYDQIQTWLVTLERSGQIRHIRILHAGKAPFVTPVPARESVPTWFTAWVRPPMQRVEYRIPTLDGPPFRIVLMTDPGDEIAEAWEETRLFLGLILALAGGCFVAISWTVGRAFQPVDAVLNALVALERGDYDHRLPDFPQPEWRRIARAFNHCAGVLARTRADNRSLTRQLLQVEEEERRTLARELHDELGQSLSGIRMLAQSIRKCDRPERASEAAGLIAEQVDHLFALVHGMIHRLRPLVLDDLGLVAALDALVDDWHRRRPDVEIHLDLDPAADRLPAEHRIHVYRIVQEALTNAFRHAKPRTIRVQLTCVDSDVPHRRWLQIHITDDGVGSATPLHQPGHGLRGMRERVESLGGRFELTTAPNQGFALTILLPFEEERCDAHPRHACG